MNPTPGSLPAYARKRPFPSASVKKEQEELFVAVKNEIIEGITMIDLFADDVQVYPEDKNTGKNNRTAANVQGGQIPVSIRF